jgi:hypothetical protein
MRADAQAGGRKLCLQPDSLVGRELFLPLVAYFDFCSACFVACGATLQREALAGYTILAKLI